MKSCVCSKNNQNNSMKKIGKCNRKKNSRKVKNL